MKFGKGSSTKNSAQGQNADARKAASLGRSAQGPSGAKRKASGKNPNRRNVWLLVLAALLAIGSIALFTPPQEKINQGLDIQGGLSVVLTAHNTEGGDVSSEDMEASRQIIESRVNALGASEATVQVQGTDQILVQIPGLSDAQDALETIGRTGQLEFARLDSFTDSNVKTQIQNGQYGSSGTYTDELGNSLPSGETINLEVEEGTYEPIVTGANIVNVTVDRESETSANYAVNIELDAAGTEAFAEASQDLVVHPRVFSRVHAPDKVVAVHHDSHAGFFHGFPECRETAVWVLIFLLNCISVKVLRPVPGHHGPATCNASIPYL